MLEFEVTDFMFIKKLGIKTDFFSLLNFYSPPWCI